MSYIDLVDFQKMVEGGGELQRRIELDRIFFQIRAYKGHNM